MFELTILGNVDSGRTECEISAADGVVAVVYEDCSGWRVEKQLQIATEDAQTFDEAVVAAKQALSRYVNRTGKNPAEGLSGAGLSLWLMTKADGGILDVYATTTAPEEPLTEVSSEVASRVSALHQQGRRIEAIRELRVATDCSLGQAKAWIANNVR